MQEIRKLDHLDMTLKAQKSLLEMDTRFDYEPLMSPHPDINSDISKTIFGKKVKAPLWISSMTGGTAQSRIINHNLARVCCEFGLGMGLGSCRTLLTDDDRFEDFHLRSMIGPDLPFYANLGIAQIEKSLEELSCDKIFKMVESLESDGLIIHINPLQEYLQLEGDKLKKSPLETLKEFLKITKLKIIVKEVGQGMGPKSLRALLELPIEGIELAGFGGTNFSEIELMRNHVGRRTLAPLATVGHSALEMVEILNALSLEYKKDIIISGGVKNFLDAHYLLSKSINNAVIGQAKNFLVHAYNYDSLKNYVQCEIEGLKVASAFLTIKESCKQ